MGRGSRIAGASASAGELFLRAFLEQLPWERSLPPHSPPNTRDVFTYPRYSPSQSLTPAPPIVTSRRFGAATPLSSSLDIGIFGRVYMDWYPMQRYGICERLESWKQSLGYIYYRAPVPLKIGNQKFGRIPGCRVASSIFLPVPG